jgi:RimJ/RimL family protein N-acetyltransferase
MYFSEIESKRFDFNIYRNYSDEIELEKILLEIKEKKVDIAILRIPLEKQFQLSELENLNIPYIIADKLMTYNLDLTKAEINPLKNQDLFFRKCTVKDTKNINLLVEQIFKDYRNHYFSNPFFDKNKITEGYKEWANSFIDNGKNDKIGWIVFNNTEDIGLATFSLNGKEIIGGLHGIRPEYSGKGIYSDFTRFMQCYFKELNFNNIQIGTQEPNHAVQKVWSNEGFILSNTFITIHINSFKK